MKICKGYVGLTCIDGNCPNALADEFPELGYKHTTCQECFYYQGCSYCAMSGTEYCDLRKEIKQ